MLHIPEGKAPHLEKREGMPSTALLGGALAEPGRAGGPLDDVIINMEAWD